MGSTTSHPTSTTPTPVVSSSEPGAFARIGMMDEAYFMYYDDSDFSARVRRAGGRIRYVPSAQVLHDVQATSRSTAGAGASSFFALYYTTRNRGRFIARNAPTTVHRLSGHAFTIVSRFVRAAQAYLGGRGPGGETGSRGSP